MTKEEHALLMDCVASNHVLSAQLQALVALRAEELHHAGSSADLMAMTYNNAWRNLLSVRLKNLETRTPEVARAIRALIQRDDPENR